MKERYFWILLTFLSCAFISIGYNQFQTQKKFNAAVIEFKTDTTKQIVKLNREKIIHTYIPEDADCAVKLWHLRDKDGKLYPADRLTCHWSQR